MFKKILFISAVILSFAFNSYSQILYKIEGTGLSKPSYILGTHHLSPLSILDSIPEWKSAFENAEQVIGEIDMTSNPMELQMKMQPFMMAPVDSTLSKLYDTATFSQLNEEFKKWSPMPGLELRMLDMMRPMVVSSMVSIEMVKKDMPGFNPNDQLDTYFQVKAKEDGKNVIGLETPEYQAEILFCSTPVAEQADALKDLLLNPDDKMESAKVLNASYLKRDLKALYDLSREEDSDFLEALIFKRNADWLSKIPELITSHPSLIVVGALHLPGERGVVEGLRKAGFTVTPAE